MKIVITWACGAEVAWRSPKPLTGVRILPGLQECVTLHDFKTIFRFRVRENMEVKFRAGSSGERAAGLNQRVDGASPSPSTHVNFLIIIKVDLNY